MSAQDFDQYYLLVGNKQVMAMITERALSREEAWKKFNHFLRNSKIHPDYGTFKVLQNTTGHLLGMAKLEIREENGSEAELGYLLQPEYWGQGYGNEIAEVLLEVAKTDPRLKRVYAITDPQNIASRKILLKNGFVSEKIGEMDGLPSEVFGRNIEL